MLLLLMMMMTMMMIVITLLFVDLTQGLEQGVYSMNGLNPELLWDVLALFEF